MVTFEEAVNIAKSVRDNLDLCVEYENGYVFSSKDDDGYIGGLNHVPVVVLKKNGRLADMNTFMFSNPGDEIRRVSI